jgi:hypothetical protein
MVLAATAACIVLAPRREKPPEAIASGRATAAEQQVERAGQRQRLTRVQLPATAFVIHRAIEEAPSWAVAYGHEFWRRRAPEPARGPGLNGPVTANFNLGDIVERVSHAITREADASLPEMRAKMFTATFDEDGVRFSPHRSTTREDGTPGLVPDASVEGRFRTMRIQRGEQTLYSSGSQALELSILGNTAQRELNHALGVVEHFETASEGVEVTWVLNQRPPGEGHLDIEAEFSGLTYSHQDAAGHHFADAEGTPRVKIGNTVLIDAKGTRTELPLVARNGRLQVQVTEQMLAQAVFPIAIDPTISPEFGMSATMADEWQQEPAIASNGTNYLVVFEDLRSFPVAVAGVRLSSAGAVLDPSGFTVANPGNSLPAVGSNGSDYLVAWEDSGDIRGKRVSSSGTVLDSTSLAISTATDSQNWVAVAGRGTNYLVVWEDYRNNQWDVYGARVSSAGAVLDASGIAICTATNIQNRPAVAALGTNFLVVWQDQRTNANFDIYGGRVSAAGAVLDGSGNIIRANDPGINQGPSVASNGTNYLVAWLYSVSSSSWEFHALRVASNGGVVDTSDLVLAALPNLPTTAPQVASDGVNYLVVWGDANYDIYGSRVTSTGTVLDPEDGFAIATSQSSEYDPHVAGMASGYLVAWIDDRNSASTEGDVYGSRVTGSGTVPDLIPISTAVAESNTQRDAAVGSDGTDFLVAWRDNRNGALNEDIYATRVRSDGVVLDLSGLTICTNSGHQFVPVIASDGTNYMVAWVDQRSSSTSRDIYINRVMGSGAVLDGNGIGVCITNGTQSYVAIANSGTTFLVAWDDDRNWSTTGSDVYAARVTSAGTVLDTNGFLIATGTNSQNRPGVASVGTNFLVAWQHDTGGSTSYDIYGARVTTAGVVLDAGGFAISNTSSNQFVPAVGSNGSDYFVVWHDYRNSTQSDIYGTRVSSGGTVLDSSGIAISTATANQYYPVIDNIGTNYMVVWADTRAGSLDIYGARVTGAGVVQDVSGFTINTATGSQDQPSIASNGSKYIVGYQSDTTGTVRLRANLVTP